MLICVFFLFSWLGGNTTLNFVRASCETLSNSTAEDDVTWENRADSSSGNLELSKIAREIPPVSSLEPVPSFVANISECLTEGHTPGEEPAQPSSVKLEVGPGFITLHHLNVEYNCCATMVVRLWESGNRLDFQEVETFPGDSNPCRCVCPYNLEMTRSMLEPGEYRVRLFNINRSVVSFDDTVIVPPEGFTCSATDCLPEPLVKRAQGDQSGLIEIFGDGNSIICRHLRAIFNCCARPAIYLRQAGFTLNFIEREHLIEPCDCLCPYNLEGRMDHLPDGIYTVNLFDGDSGQLLATETVELPATGFTYWASDCVVEISAVVNLKNPDVIRVEIGDGYFRIYHYGVMYNCCATMVVRMEETMTGFDFYEIETYPNSSPCYCICPFNLKMGVSGLAPGEYEVNVYNEDESTHYYHDWIFIPPFN